MPGGSKQTESKVQKDQRLSDYLKKSDTRDRLVEQMRKNLVDDIQNKCATIVMSSDSFNISCQSAAKGTFSLNLIKVRDKFGFTNDQLCSDKTWRMVRQAYIGMTEKAATAAFKSLKEAQGLNSQFFTFADAKGMLDAGDFGAWVRVMFQEVTVQEVINELPLPIH